MGVIWERVFMGEVVAITPEAWGMMAAFTGAPSMEAIAALPRVIVTFTAEAGTLIPIACPGRWRKGFATE